MGHLFSRAFKRLTQCSSQTRNQPQQQQKQQHREKPVEQQATNRDNDQSNRPFAQSIQVGQSIDSAEYAALDSNNRNNTGIELSGSQKPDDHGNNHVGDSPKQADVEGAVIKIQALVRGHLTRKALKDAHQHSAPPLDALGQSQFDEESLTNNPPSAVFLPSSPLNNSAPLESLSQQLTSSINKTIANDQSTSTTRTHLESIAEVLEAPSAAGAQPETSSQVLGSGLNSDESERKKLAALYSRSSSSPSKFESKPTRGSMSPVPSEANASIDLNCDSPTSASIDISDHNLKPTDRIASVLHPRSDEPKGVASAPQITQSRADDLGAQTPDDQVGADVQPEAAGQAPALGTPDLLGDSEEAAAIRIQSAFRGYRSRKNSPYRTRSPTASPVSLKRQALRQQEAAVLAEEESADDGQTDQADQVIRAEGRRSSRARQRDFDGDADGSYAERTGQVAEDLQQTSKRTDPLIDSSVSLDENTSKTDDTTVKEIVESVIQEARNDQHSALIESRDSFDNGQEPGGSKLAQQADQTGIQTVSLSQYLSDIGDLDASADPETEENLVRQTLPNLSAALEAPSVSANTNNDQAGEGFDLPSLAPRPSVGSGETDSSVLGAALSEELSEAPVEQATMGFKQIDEDRLAGDVSMTTDEIESEARRLVDEMTAASNEPMESQTNRFNQLEAALDDATTADDSFAANEGVLLNEEEQRAIELESDDIERRDPRGQVSEERAKSPQIIAETTTTPTFGIVELADDELRGELGAPVSSGLSLGQQQSAGLLLAESGRSSPAFNSSGCGSSSDSDPDPDPDPDRDEDLEPEDNLGQNESANQKKKQQQQPQQSAGASSTTPTSRNKKRNRNKKKGKK